jgi:hypothetical protein
LDNIANDDFKLFLKEANMKRNSWFVCIVWLCMIFFTGSQVHSQEKKQSSLDPYSLRVMAVLVDKNDVPLKGKRVVAYPLNAKGEALLIRTMPPGYVAKVWNPVTETDSTGKFVFDMPMVARIDNNKIAEVVIGVGNPSGGLSLRSETGIEYVDPKQEKEDCLTRDIATSDLSLLRKGADILKVKMSKGSKEIDLGKIVVE